MFDNARLVSTLSFLIRLTLLSFPLYLIATSFDLFFLQQWVAGHVHFLLNAAGVVNMLSGATLDFGSFSVLVSRDSSGWKSLAFVAALILASRGSHRAKLVGIILAFPAIYCINLFRIAVTSYSAFYGVEIFNLLHDVLWQFGMILAVVAVWFLWLLKRDELERLQIPLK